MPGKLEFEFGFGRPQEPTRRRSESALRILIMGDFSGRARQVSPTPAAPLGERRPIAIDIDNFDTVLARFAPCAQLPLGDVEGATTTIAFRQLDDFHPDALYGRAELLQGLRNTRARLANPATCAEAAAELLPSTPAPAEAKPASTQAESEGQMLDRLLGKPMTATTPSTPATHPGIEQFIKRVIQPHIVADANTRLPELLAGVDAAIGEQMRGLLHQPAFQALEATWRGVNNLVTGLETDELTVHLLDVTQQELVADVRAAAADLRQSGLYRVLVESARTPGGEPWSLLVGDYYFGATAEDIALLAALGALGAQAGGPFLAGARIELLGCETTADLTDPSRWHSLTGESAQHWQRLRTHELSRWLGLALPRMLLRLPYAERSDPIESFDFEELPSSEQHDAYLWGNPAFACAQLLGMAFMENGWEMQPGDCLDIEDLPAYTFSAAGERCMQPCAEVLLGERATQAILQRGIMPLLSYRNRNAARLARFQSLAEPAADLAGPWR
ncbi:MAG: type VI secretion system contractile sheath large subunit [Gammaproteobacteria bacterium]|nr:type VI secretion system contractile sheath large subunit [Gammaproteobacteria bacterium]MCP5425527.1 type VI secretion system contractile sheath large subunit [Gammaproteobacteria bacterium]MCP5459353.1 type VI secretion system contractile sheath large subunit [Gammaproteobacteria bacterium]